MKDKVVNLRLNSELYEEVLKIAQSRGLSFSEYARKMITFEAEKRIVAQKLLQYDLFAGNKKEEKELEEFGVFLGQILATAEEFNFVTQTVMDTKSRYDSQKQGLAIAEAEQLKHKIKKRGASP